MAKPFFRQGIPDGSVYRIRVIPEDNAPVVANAHFRNPDASETVWTDPQLKAGRQKTLRSPGVYAGRVNLDFAAQGSAILEMQVDKPDGTKHVYRETIARGAGLDRTIVLMVMKRS
jgi:hypothetical protein